MTPKMAGIFRQLFRKSDNSGSPPPSAEPLLDAMQRVAVQDTPQAREVVYAEFLKSWLWICVPELPDGFRPGMTTLATGMKISVATPNNTKGVRVLPAFTDLEALRNYDPNTPQLALPATEVFKMAVQLAVGGIMINPFDPVRKPIRPGGNLTRREFEALAAGMIPTPTLDGSGQVLTAKKSVQIQIAPCTTPMNSEIKSRLQAAARQFANLSRIYRYRMRYVETGSESEVFGVICDAQGDELREIITHLMSSIKPSIAPDHYVDFIVLHPEQLLAVQNHSELVYGK